MKTWKQYFIHFSSAILLSTAVQAVSAAEIDLLNLANLEEGDTSLGTNLIVKVDDTGKKFVVGNNNLGQLLAPVSLPMESEVNISTYLYIGNPELFLLADEYQVKLTLHNNGGSYSKLTGNALTSSSQDASSAWIDGYNTVRVAMTGGEVKIYVNDVFSQKATLRDENITFTQIKLNDIGTNPSYEALYEFKAGGNVTTVAPPISAGEIDLLNLASLEEDDTSLGTNLIVKTDDIGTKYVVGHNNLGQLLASVSLSMESEVNISSYLYIGSPELFLLAGEDHVKLTLHNNGGNYSKLTGNALTSASEDASSAWVDGYNKVRVALTDGKVKVYVNDVFSQKATLRDENITFTQIKLNDIGTNPSYEALYEFKAGGNVTTACGVSDPLPTPNPSASASIDANLNINIPSAIYQPIFGEAMDLSAYLQFVPAPDGSLSWTLGNYGVNQ